MGKHGIEVSMVQIADFEKLGLFYLGKGDGGEPLLFKAKDLTTHALIVGMTGSGKTGLGIDLLEEAAIDHVPCLIIDPKGDMGDLALTMPHLSQEEFAPWCDKPEIESAKWKEGLKKWGMDEKRIGHLVENRETVIYTPASSMGCQLSVLGSFTPPIDGQEEAALTLTSSLLSLLGVKADPISSKEHILISTIIQNCWDKQESIDITRLIQEVQNPPFARIGALDMDLFYPQKERMGLAITLNNLLASPRFQKWREGEPLDIERLLYTKDGKVKQSIFSLNHLGDNERMFFVTLLLNELINWMRKQEGTDNLRALLYMDEIFGYFPPNSAPPSKGPMLTLLKTARAYGVGVVLSTQNPADLDYKGLSNCGTWFIGKLQTERDRQRLTEGLQTAYQGQFDKDLFNKLGNRHFLLHSVHQGEPTCFETRWTLSYLKGPLTLAQIATLTKKGPKASDEKKTTPQKPLPPSGYKELYMEKGGSNRYSPFVLAQVKLHFEQKGNIDLFERRKLAYKASSEGIDLDHPELIEMATRDKPLQEAQFEELPLPLLKNQGYEDLKKRLTEKLYNTETYPIYTHKESKVTSKSHESVSAFRARVLMALREKREGEIEAIKVKMQAKIDSVEKKLKSVSLQIESGREADKSRNQETFISMGSTVLDALLKKGKGLSKAGDIIKRATRLGKESAKTAQAKARYQALQEELQSLENEMEEKIASLPPLPETSQIPYETLEIRPTKRDIEIEQISLLWIAL